MLVRPITKEERLQSAQLFAIAFESPFDPNDLTPFAENPCIWAAFDEESGEMMSTVYVTDYRVQFDGGRYKMGGIGGVASLPQYRRAGGIRACFQKALPILYREGYVFSYLYPFSTAYYRKFGYESCVQRYLAVLDLRQLRPAEFSGSFRLARGGDMLLPAIRQLDERWEAQYNMMVQHAEADYRWLLSAAPASKQEFIYAAFSAAGEPLGYAAFKKQDEPDGRNLVCSRLRFSGKDGFAALMHLFSRFASDHRFVKFPLPCCTAMQYLLPEWSLGAVRWELQSAGMVRVVNAAAEAPRSGCMTRRSRKTMRALPSSLKTGGPFLSAAQIRSRMQNWRSARSPRCCAACAIFQRRGSISPASKCSTNPRRLTASFSASRFILRITFKYSLGASCILTAERT